MSLSDYCLAAALVALIAFGLSMLMGRTIVNVTIIRLPPTTTTDREENRRVE